MNSQENAPGDITPANHDLEWVISAQCYPIAKFHLSRKNRKKDALRTTHSPFIHPTPVVMFTFSSKVKPAIWCNVVISQ